jgi:prophage tail gpP-like protein
MTLKVKIADSTAGNAFVERQSYIDWESFNINEVISNSPDSCSFLIKKQGAKIYEPLIGEQIQVTADGVTIFGGYIVDVDKSATALAGKVKIKCKDYTQALDRVLVSKTYTNVTANFIISDLMNTFASGLGFTISGVNANVIVQKIIFNYLTISQCLSKLATLLGTYEWNIGFALTNSVYNGDQEIAPVLVAPQTASNKWVDGTAAGSSTPNIYRIYPSGSASFAVSFDNTVSHSGTTSLKVATTATGQFVEVRNDNAGYNTSTTYGMPISPNTAYTLKYWLKTQVISGTADNGAFLKILRATSAGTYVAETGGTPVKVTQDWTEYTVNFTSGPTEALAHLEYRLYGHQGVGTLIMNAWFDDVTLTATAVNPDIQFFDVSAMPAPYEINDTGGNFNYSSLVIHRTVSQLRNKIIIRGGITEGDLFTDYKTADGVQKTFFLGYDLANILASISIGTTIGSGFTALTVGTDGKDIETDFDVMYNADNGLLRFKDSNIPVINKIIKYSGNPRRPLISSKTDSSSVATYGTYEYVIVDKSIKSKAAAAQRATAELLNYARPQATISFTTNVAGLKTGQRIRVNSTNYGIIDEYYKIINITSAMRSPTTFTYKVELTLAEDMSLVQLLKQMLLTSQSNQIDVSDSEVVDRLFSADETATFSETVAFSLSHNMTSESVAFSETVTSNKNYGTEFVAGPYTMSGVKRVFLLDASPLG